MSTIDSQLSDAGIEVASMLDQQLLTHYVDVPLLPDVASRVLQLSNDPDSDAAELAKLIQSDQALAAHVMRIANSAAYTPNASMVSLQQAVARLGMNLIAEIAIAASLNSKLFKAPGYEKRIEEIWAHALCSALWGKEIARAAKQNVEASFLCGLLHTVGRPAVLQSLSELEQKHEVTFDPEEGRLLEDHYHVPFGAEIVQRWEMPAVVCESVEHYLDYTKSETKIDQAMVVFGASQLADMTLSGEESEEDALEKIKESGVFADLNLYEDEVAALVERESFVKSGLEAMRI